MAIIKRKLSDGVSGSEGGGDSAGGGDSGIRARVSRGGGGGFNPVGSEADLAAQAAQKAQKEAENKAQQLAYAERVRENQAQYERQKQEEAARKSEAGKKYETTTGKYVKGGYIVQETRGDYATLVKLGGQQPGSTLVQETKGGNFVLIKGRGIDQSKTKSLESINERIGLEGGTPYVPIKPTASGGKALVIGLKDNIGVSEPTPEFPESTTEETELEPGRPTKYTVYPGSGGIKAEQGTAYKVELSDTIGNIPQGREEYKYQSARDIAQAQSEGRLPLGFI